MAEVTQLDCWRPARQVAQNVLELDISVNDLLCVQVMYRIAQLKQHRVDSPFRERSMATQQLLAIAPLHKLKHKYDTATALDEVVPPHHVRMGPNKLQHRQFMP
mmetsp:Transcript_63167/g.105066  ORF Transcript_63167/g.105066 Transcript_63167/m.105066 type:complete len:104 (-) Transcript_63167:316-627(-)